MQQPLANNGRLTGAAPRWGKFAVLTWVTVFTTCVVTVIFAPVGVSYLAFGAALLLIAQAVVELRQS